MASANGTTKKTGRAFVSQSSKNQQGSSQKSVHTSANRMSQKSQEGAATNTYRRTHNGPF